MDRTWAWEPGYGFCGTATHGNTPLAVALEVARRRVCAYGSIRDEPCDCKYGARPGQYAGSEATGCPELREVIHRLLYRPETFGSTIDTLLAEG